MVDPRVGVSGSAATPTSDVTIDLSTPLTLPSLGLGVVSLARELLVGSTVARVSLLGCSSGHLLATLVLAW